VVEQWTQTRSVAECLRTLEAAGVPCAHYAEPGDTLADPQLRQRGLFAPVADAAGSFTGVNAPWQMSGSGSALGDHVPDVGEHVHEVLAEWLQMDEAAIARLRSSGALGNTAA
jgi:CoA:oxalate CoA-transferase